jgi:hypothetical protein
MGSQHVRARVYYPRWKRLPQDRVVDMGCIEKSRFIICSCSEIS